jgi:peptide/nickel transport system permease protein
LKLDINFHKKDICIWIGGLILISLVITAGSIPFMDLLPPGESSKEVLVSPSREHILGTNDVGQDIFSRLLYGLRVSIFTSLSVGLAATLIAGFLGSMAALTGGAFDRFILRLCDVFLALPEFIICLLIASYIRPNVITLILIISLLNWQGPLKVIRSQVVICKENLSVYTARTFGANKIHILRKHIIPEILPLLISTFIRNARVAVFMEASLSYLGLVDPKTISWGKIMGNAMAFTYLDVWKWWLLPVGVVLSLFLLSLSYIGYYMENKRNVYLEEIES